MMDEVAIWLVDSVLPQRVLVELHEHLDEDERARVAALPPERKAEFVAAHGVARVVAGQALGLAPRRVRWRFGPNGKPETDGVRVSLSRSGGLAVVARTATRAVGVDLQRVEPELDAARIAARFYPAAEARHVVDCPPGQRAARFTGLFARKEACVKAAGGRLFPGLRQSVSPGGSGGVVRRADGPYRVRDLSAPTGFAAAVALAGEDDYRVREHRWPEEWRDVEAG